MLHALTLALPASLAFMQVRADFPSLASLRLSDLGRLSGGPRLCPLPSLAGLTCLALRLQAHSSKRVQMLSGGTDLRTLELAIGGALTAEQASSTLVRSCACLD